MASAEFHELVKKLRSRPREENPTIEQLRVALPRSVVSFRRRPARRSAVNASGVPAEWYRSGRASPFR
jgi:hypothetical protein